MLTARLQAAVDAGAGSFREELRLSGRAYVDFALSHPDHLKVMFSARRFDIGADCIHGMEDLDAFARINGVFERAIEKRVIETEQPSHALALLVWAQVHGLSHILIEKQVPPEAFPADAVYPLIDEHVELLSRGLGCRE